MKNKIHGKVKLVLDNTALKGKLAHKFSTCYLERISYHLPMDKKLMAETNGYKLYNLCIQGKENHIWKSHHCGFPNKSLCDVIRLGSPIKKKMEFLCC